MPRVDGWPPRWLTKVAAADRRRGDGAGVAEFIEAYGRITKETIAGHAGDPLELRGWQHHLLEHLFARDAQGKRIHRQALIGIARKNGKSALLSGIGLYGLLVEDPGAEVYSCAGDKDQARIVFAAAKRMVELSPELSEETKLYRDAIEVPSTGSVYRVVSSDAPLKEGLSPTLVCFDELHVQPNDELYNVMSLGSGARAEPLLLSITTAGARTDSLGQDTVCYRLYQHGQRVVRGEIDDPTFFFAWWEPKAGTDADHTDPAVWAEANPGYDDIVAAEDFESTVARIPEGEFRTKRTNVWVVSLDRALPHGAWERLAEPNRGRRDCDVVMFLDGSYDGDSTGLVAVTIEERPHIFVVDAWENPDDPHWRVNIADVEAAVLTACREMPVREIPCDPYRWQRSMQILMDDGLPISEYPMTVARVVPAWQKFYDAVMDGLFTHDGDPRLARHIENMVLKRDSRGVRPTKEHSKSRRRIDLGICAVGAFDRATARVEPALEPMVGFV